MKHVPMRMCIVTRQRTPKSELCRFVIHPDTGKFALDVDGKIRSRGANLTMDLQIFDKAVEGGHFKRALGKKISPEEYAEVRKELEEHIEAVKFRAGRKKVNFRVKSDKGVKIT